MNVWRNLVIPESNSQRYDRLALYSHILNAQNRIRRSIWLSHPDSVLMERALAGRASVYETIYGCPSRETTTRWFND